MTFRADVGDWKWLFERCVVVAPRPVYFLLVAKVIFPYYREIKSKKVNGLPVLIIFPIMLTSLTLFSTSSGRLFIRFQSVLSQFWKIFCPIPFVLPVVAFIKKTTDGICLLPACPINVVTTLVKWLSRLVQGFYHAIHLFGPIT